MVPEDSCSEAHPPAKKSGPTKSNRKPLMLLVLVVIALLAAAKLLPVKEYLTSLLEWTEGLGVWGPVAIAVIYVPACVFMVPGSMLTLGAGLMFGVVKGTIAISIGSTIGACCAFLVGRTIGRGWVEQKIARNEKFAAVSNAVGEQGFKIVLLTRLSPVFPFNLLNYAYGLTTVSFRDYALASWIGMLPGTLLYVYLGSSARSLAEATAGTGDKSTAQTLFFWFGLAITLAVTVFVTRVARRALKEAVSDTVEGEKS